MSSCVSLLNSLEKGLYIVSVATGSRIHDPAFPQGVVLAGSLSITPAATSLNHPPPPFFKQSMIFLMNEKYCSMFDAPPLNPSHHTASAHRRS